MGSGREARGGGPSRRAARGIGARALAAVFGVALALRIGHLVATRGSVLAGVLLGDAKTFDAWGRALAGGDWLGAEVFYQAPLYPYLVGVVYRLAGAEPVHVLVLQALLGAASCALLAAAAARWLGAAVGAASGFVLAVYAPEIWVGGLLQKECLAGFLTSALLLSLAAGRARVARALLGGVLLGLLVLTRENAGVLLPAFVLAWFLEAPRPRLGPGARLAGAFALGFALALAPVVVRNQAVGGEPVPTASNAGVNFWIGNGAGATGTYRPLVEGRGHPDFERDDATELAEEALGRALSSAQVSAYWLERGLADVRADPGRWARLLGRKAVLLANREELMDADSLEAWARSSRVLAVLRPVTSFATLLPLALLGLGALRGRWREVWILPVSAALLAASLLLFFVAARYRLGMLPFLVPLAAQGGLSLVAAARARRFGSLALAIAPAVALGWVLHRPVDLGGSQEATTWMNVAAELRNSGRACEAVRWAEEAAALEPDSADALYTLGIAQMTCGDLASAEASLERSLRLERGSTAGVHAALGLLWARRGDVARAEPHLRTALAQERDQPNVWKNLGLALRLAGRPVEAVEAFVELRRLAPDDPEPALQLGELLAGLGRGAEARDELRRALSLDPGSPVSGRAAAQLAWLLATSPDAAVRDGAEAVRLAERLAAGPAPSAAALDVLAAAYAEAGRFEEAVRAGERALAGAAPDQRPALEARLARYRGREPWRGGERSAGG